MITDTHDPRRAEFRRAVSPVLPGLLFAILTLLFGFGLGVVFGLNEDLIKSRLAASAATVEVSIYHQDAAAMKAVLSKSWVYMQRAHLHAGSLGTAAVALSVVLMLLDIRPAIARSLSLALGVGGLGYSLYWLWAGFRAPSLGGTDAAKESLAWLAIPASGLVVAATTVTFVLLAMQLFSRKVEMAAKADDLRR